MECTESVNKAAGAPSELNVELERIKCVIDRVLWTAGATEWNKRLLAEAIAEEIGDIAAAEREACANVCEALRDEWSRLKVGAKDGRYDIMEDAASVCEDEIRKRSNGGV